MSEDPTIPPAQPTEEKPPAPVLPYSSRGAQVLQYSSAAISSDDWIEVFRARDYLEANLLVGKLQEQGIRARVDSENVAAMGSWAGGGPGGSNVQVMSSEAAQARRMIDELEKIRAARHAPNRVPCPKCQHTPSLRTFRPVRVMAVVSIALCMAIGLLQVAGAIPRSLPGIVPMGLIGIGIVLLLVPATPRWWCPECGHRWAQAEPDEIDEEEEEEEDEDEEEEDDDSDEQEPKEGGR